MHAETGFAGGEAVFFPAVGNVPDQKPGDGIVLLLVDHDVETDEIGCGHAVSLENFAEERLGALVLRVGEELFRGPLFEDHAVVHKDDAVGHFAGMASARARATRCCCPPEISLGRLAA